jgi:two-component system sensor histidine kinase DegS
LVAVEKGREQIFGIAEAANSELDRLNVEGAAPAGTGDMTRNASPDTGPLQEKSPDLLEQERQALIQVAKQADILLTRFGVALQCLQEAAPGADLAEDWPSRKKAGQLVVRMLDIERHRIAREIHDGPAQAMANLLLRTVFCEQQLAGESSVVQDELLNLKKIIRSTLLEIRKILFNLQLKDLDQGLLSGLHRLINEYQERYTLQVMFNCSGQDRRLGSQMTGALFRIVQEALNNVYKHSCSDLARVDLELAEHRVTVCIFDEGKGFDLQEAASSGGHYGLMNMRERAQLLDGVLQIMTAPGQGTRIIVTIPIE